MLQLRNWGSLVTKWTMKLGPLIPIKRELLLYLEGTENQWKRLEVGDNQTSFLALPHWAEKCFFWSFSCHRKCCFRPWQVRGWQATLSLGATRLDSTLWSFLSLLGFSAWNSVLAENRNTNEHQKEDTKMSDSKPFVRSQVSQVFFWLSSPVWGAPLSDF